MIIDDLIVLQQAILLAAFLFALWKADWYLRLLAAGALFFMLGYLAVDAQLRYMVTIMPVIIVISAAGIHRFFLRDDPGRGVEQFRETEQITPG
jgi:predicted neutral ceramidase superfamily lipid hydrolase